MSKNIVDLEELFEAHAKKLYNFFYFKTLNRQQAEDLTSETFLALAKSIHNVPKEPEKSKKYLYGIAQNIWNQYLRAKYKNVEDSVEDIEDFSTYVARSNEEIQSLSIQERAMKYITQLPDKQRDVAQLRLIQGYSVIEIAEMLKIDKNTVKVTLRRSMRSLEKLVNLDKPSHELKTGGSYE